MNTYSTKLRLVTALLAGLAATPASAQMSFWMGYMMGSASAPSPSPEKRCEDRQPKTCLKQDEDGRWHQHYDFGDCTFWLGKQCP